MDLVWLRISRHQSRREKALGFGMSEPTSSQYLIFPQTRVHFIARRLMKIGHYWVLVVQLDLTEEVCDL